jgi:hypothetical protein
MSRARDLADGTFSGAFSADSPTLVVDDTNNRVGVGTASPTDLLHLSAGAGFNILLERTGASPSECFIKNSGNMLQFSNDVSGIRFDTGVTPTEVARIDSSGRLGIGTSSPTHKIDVVTDGGTQLRLAAWDLSATARSNIDFWYLDSGGTPYNNAQISALAAANAGNGNLVFSTRPTSGSLTECARIDSSGDFRIGNTSGTWPGTDGLILKGSGVVQASVNSSPSLYLNRGVSNGPVANFARSSTTVGSISVTVSSTAYNTTSDYRLKENVADLTGAIDRVKQVPVHRFNFIADPDKTVDGFLAHEVADIVPEAITGTKDGMKTEEYEVTPAVLDDDGNVVTEAVMGTREVPEYQGIDQSKLVPLLTAAIKEQQALIEDLQTRLAALEAV